MIQLFFKFLLMSFVLIPIDGFSLETRDLTWGQRHEINGIDNTLVDLFKGTWGKGSSERNEGCKKNKHRLGTASNPTEMDQGVLEVLDGLYTSGYFKDGTEIKSWKTKYFNLRTSTNYRKLRVNDKDGDTDYHDGAIISGCNRKQRWKNLYDDFGDKLRTFLKGRKIECANEGDIATVLQCCDQSSINPYAPIALPFIGYKKPSGSTCKMPGIACTNHADCCSQQCMLNSYTGTPSGTCAPVLSCYKRVPKDEECHPIKKPYCITPWNTGGWNNKQFDVKCMPVDHESVGIGECKSITQTCTSDTQCCSDKCVSGKCDFNSQCMACLNNGDPYIEADGIPCCPGHYPGMGEHPKCLPKFPPLILPTTMLVPKKKSILQNLVDFILPSAYAVESCNYFNQSQRLEIQKETEGCFNEPDTDENGINECLKTVTILKAGYRTTNFTNESKILDDAIKACGDEACKDEARSAFQEKCNKYTLTRMEHATTYNIPSIRSKTTSNLETCKFNNMNDAWAASTPDERNAELVVRAFEYLFSGGGAQDFWVEKGSGKNIFTRSQNISAMLKQKRIANIQKMQEKDVLMMCKCILAKKGAGIPQDVMSFFNVAPECEADKTALDEILSNKDVSHAVGATGISHEAFLVSYTKLKMETSLDQFNDYTKINEDLDSLVKYLNGDSENAADWYEGEIGFKEIYSFKVKWMSTWFKIFLIVVAVAIITTAIILTGGALGAGLGTAMATMGSTVGMGFGVTAFSFAGAMAWGVTTVMLATALVSAGISSLFKNKIAKPKIRDVVIESKNNAAAYDEDKNQYDWGQGKKWNWLGTHKYMKIKRYYDFPYYQNPESGCNIKATANLCIRNMFLTTTKDGLRYLTDVKKPLFVSDYAYPDDIHFPQMMNASHDYLMTKLKGTNPGSVTKRKFLKRQILSEPDIQKAMMPLQGSYVPDAFDEQKAMKVMAAVKTFAKCKEITGSKATPNCKLPTGKLGVEDGDLGFGYFFESQDDINDFAAYFYQHHFHWPSITASSQIGYPLLGQNIYYQTILHNIRVIMASAADRSKQFGDLYDLYQSDWNKRVKDYSCSSGKIGEGDNAICALINAGQSNNVKYSDQFRFNFKKIDFRMGELPAMMTDGNSEIKLGDNSHSKMSAG